MGRRSLSFQTATLYPRKPVFLDTSPTVANIKEAGFAPSVQSEQARVPDDESHGNDRGRAAEVERARTEAHAFLDQLVERGWNCPSAGNYVHPSDPELSVHFNILTNELLVSPKMAEKGKELFKAENGAGAGAPPIPVVMSYMLRAVHKS